MNPTKNNWSLRIGVFILALTLVWIFTQIQAQNKPPVNQETDLTQLSIEEVSKPEEEPTGETETSQLFFYAEIKDNVTYLYSYDTATSEKKLYYYDGDETDKVIRALGLDKEGNILILEGATDQSGAAKLVSVGTDGKADKKILAHDIFTVNPPVLAPDQNKIAITSFSNAEANFGFSLFIQNLDGSNKRKIAQAKTNILSPSFSSDSTKLAYVINRGKQGSKIEVYSLNESSAQTVLVTPKIITSIGWLNDNLVASMSPAGTATANQSELYEIRLPGATLKQLTDNQVNENNLFSFDSDQRLAYISQKLASGITGQNPPGEIKIYGQEIDFKDVKASYLFGYKE
jgi:Tol biopolymer transport system component